MEIKYITQKKRHSLLEAFINTLVGYWIATVANYYVLPLFNLHPSFAESAHIGIIFTFISLIRSYILRRIFNWWHKKGY